MSTYINGVTTYIPQIQPSDVNLAVESQYANFRLQKHDAAKKQLSDLYGSLLNSPLSRQDNIDARDKFFEAIEGQVKKISGMDLSLDQNVQQAASIFNQLLDDKYILKDMSWTRNYENELLNSQYLKNACTDPDKCNGEWWDGGDRLLEYDREAFANASADESLRFGNTRYIPKQNVTKRALDLAKKYDVDIKYEDTDGTYIVTQKNGQLAIPTFQMMFNGMIADDPSVREYYGAKARVERLDYMHQHAEEYGSMEAAERAYINDVMSKLQYVTDENGNIVRRVSQQEILNNDAQNAKDNSDYNKTVGSALAKRGEAIGSKSYVDRGNKMVEDSYYFDREYDRANSVISKINRDNNFNTVSGDQVDSILAYHMLGSDVQNAVLMASSMKAEQTIREDKYGLERFKAALAAEKKRDAEINNDISKMFGEHTGAPITGVGIEDDEQRSIFKEFMDANSNAVESFDIKNLADIAKVYQKIMDNDSVSEETKAAFRSIADKVKKAVGDVNKTSGSQGAVASLIGYNPTNINNLKAGLNGNPVSPSRLQVDATTANDLDTAIKLTEDLLDFRSLSESEQNAVSKLHELGNNYKVLLGAKQASDNIINQIIEKMPSYQELIDENGDRSAMKLLGMSKAIVDGKFTDVDMLKSMYSAGGKFQEYMDNSQFFNKDGSDYVNMSLGEIYAIYESADSQNWLEYDESSVARTMRDALRKNGINKVTKELNPNAHYEYVLVGPSPVPKKVDSNEVEVWVDSNGNEVIDKDGNITDIGKSILNKPVDVYIQYAQRRDMIDHGTAILHGQDEFSRGDYNSPFVTIFGKTDATTNFDKEINKLSRLKGLIAPRSNEAYGWDTNGQLVSETYKLNPANNEEDYAFGAIISSINALSLDNNQNYFVTFSNAADMDEAKDMNKDFVKFLNNNGISMTEFFGAVENVMYNKARRQKHRAKTGEPIETDFDSIGQFLYNPIALNTRDYSYFSLPPKLCMEVEKELGFKAGTMAEQFGVDALKFNIYNNKKSSSRTFLDDMYDYTVTDMCVDMVGKNNKYTGFTSEWMTNVSVWRDGDWYHFKANFLDYVDRNGVRQWMKEPIEQEYQVDDGVKLAWSNFQQLAKLNVRAHE